MTDRCNRCGKYILLDETVKVLFTPDTEFSAERTEFLCKECGYVDGLEKEINRLRDLIIGWSNADDPEHPAVEALWDEAQRIRARDCKGVLTCRIKM